MDSSDHRLEALEAKIEAILGNAEQAAHSDGVRSTRTRQRRVGFFTSWGVYGHSGYHVKNLVTSASAGRLTHLVYCFANIGSDGTARIGDPWADYQARIPAQHSVDGQGDRFEQPLAGNFNQLRKLKARYPDLRVMMAVGGDNWSEHFPAVAATDQSRRKFVASCLDLFVHGDLPINGEPQGGPGSAAGIFDGIDIDWEWPTGADRRNVSALLAEFRRQLDEVGAQHGKHYALSLFVPSNPDTVEGFDETIFDAVDFVTMQGYDMHGPWDPTTNHQAAVYPSDGDPSWVKYSWDLGVRTWLDKGAPPERFVVGAPLFSQHWTGVPSENNGLFQRGTGVHDKPAFRLVNDQPGKIYRDLFAFTAWKYDGSSWWTLDDPIAMWQKAAWVNALRLGGVAVWELSGDTASGLLLAAIDLGLASSNDDIAATWAPALRTERTG